MSTHAAKAKKDPEFVLDTDAGDFEVLDEVRENTSKERSPKVNINFYIHFLSLAYLN